ncbi:hypothetical protein Scep_019767 [Stephania cephalantha]|uniref:DUF4283 domain-containing protein n=1 Tax=Stephania cephalantha TaxID=152367 RepID=A0AAP0IBT1_9MAGN
MAAESRQREAMEELEGDNGAANRGHERGGGKRRRKWGQHGGGIGRNPHAAEKRGDHDRRTPAPEEKTTQRQRRRTTISSKVGATTLVSSACVAEAVSPDIVISGQRGANVSLPSIRDIVQNNEDDMMTGITVGNEIEIWMEDIRSISFSERVRKQIVEAMDSTIMVRLLSRTVSFRTMADRLKNMRNPTGRMMVTNAENGYFMVRFDLMDDCLSALLEGPWTILGHYLLVQPYYLEFDTREVVKAEASKVMVTREMPLLSLRSKTADPAVQIAGNQGNPVIGQSRFDVLATSDEGNIPNVSKSPTEPILATPNGKEIVNAISTPTQKANPKKTHKAKEVSVEIGPIV